MAENMREVRQQLPRARHTGTEDLQPMQQSLILDRGAMTYLYTQMTNRVSRRRLRGIQPVLVLVLVLDGRGNSERKKWERPSCQSRPSLT